MRKPYAIFPHDIGYLHVLDFALHRAVRELVTAFQPAIPTIPPVSRYLDAEDFRSGDRHA